MHKCNFQLQNSILSYKFYMFDKRLQEIKLQLNALALQNDLNYDQMIKYLNGFDLRPKKLHSYSSQKFNSQSSFNTTRKCGKQNNVTIAKCFDKQNISNQAQSLSKIQISMGDTDDHLEEALQEIEDSLAQLNGISQSIMENILEISATGKIYKIRQNFRDLVLNILSLSGMSFFIYHESGRIQFQNFSENYITEILSSDLKYQVLQRILLSSSEDSHMVDISDNNDYIKIFQLDPSKISRGIHYSTILKWNSDDQDSLIVCVALETFQISELDEVKQLIGSKILKKIIEISMIETSQYSISSVCKTYSKKMLDLLQILINLTENKLKRKLCQKNDIKIQSCYSVNNLIKIIINKYKNQIKNGSIRNSIKKLSEKFQQSQYRLIEEIRMYKKYINEGQQILLEFNKNGKLLFCSSHKNREILNTLSSIWEHQKPILFLLFQNNSKLQIQYKKAIKGNVYDRYFQIAKDTRARILHKKSKIDKIQVIIQDNDQSSTSFHASKDSETRKKRRKNINLSRPEQSTIKAIQEQHPGITQQGWLDLFYRKKENQRTNSAQKKKHNTYLNQDFNITEKDSFMRVRSHTSYVQYKDEQLQDFRQAQFQKLDINVLNYSDKDLDVFARNLLHQLQYFKNLNVDKQKLQNFLYQLHDYYQLHSNPFHNFKHGVNVMHTCYIIATLKQNAKILTSKNIFAIVFSGLCHDVGHTGFTNDFQIASKSKKALTYNDKSPLQNYHASTTFEILRKSENNIFQSLSHQQFRDLRNKIIQNILFTDIKQHFPLLKKFEEAIKLKSRLTKDDASLLSCMIVHSSDFAGSIKSFQICRQWSERVNQQFIHQYSQQGRLDLPQTPFMKDLDKLSVMSKGQCGFLKVIVFPLYQALKKLYLASQTIQQFNKNIENNIKEWQYIHMSQLETEKAKIDKIQ